MRRRKAERATARFIRNELALRRAKGENRDHYGRLLRYVRNRNGKDLGTYPIKRGVAVARYDSRDGYGWHRLQAKYHRLDAKQRNVCGFDPTEPRPRDPGGTGGGERDPNYRGCVCAARQSRPRLRRHRGSVRVVGSDPHGFDADGDGWGCESS